VSVSRETNNYDHLLNASKRGVEIVMFNRINKDLGFSTVGIDDYNGAFKAVEHLIQQGYRRIAHLAGPQNLQIGRERLRGYKDALLRNNLPLIEDLIIPYDLTEEKAKIYSAHLLNLNEPPDALFAINDPTAIAFLLVAQERGVKIPQEVGVVGFSYDPISAYIPPGLSTVSQPTHQIGRKAAQLLLQRIQNVGTNIAIEHKVLETQLIIRGSSRRV
jgi:LacI family transcriptional regulator/LacI family repressor for deo operon, udp, cdd, tsx, nupC, and nupG